MSEYLLIYIIYYYMSSDKLQKVLKKYKEKYELTKADFFEFVRQKVELTDKKCAKLIEYLELQIKNEFSQHELTRLMHLVAAFQAGCDLKTLSEEEIAGYSKMKFKEKRKNQQLQKSSSIAQSEPKQYRKQEKKQQLKQKVFKEQQQQKEVGMVSQKGPQVDLQQKIQGPYIAQIEIVDNIEEMQDQQEQIQLRIQSNPQQDQEKETIMRQEIPDQDQIKDQIFFSAKENMEQIVDDDYQQEDKSRLYRQIEQQQKREKERARERQRQQAQKRQKQRMQMEKIRKQQQEVRRQKQKQEKELRQRIRRQIELELKEKQKKQNERREKQRIQKQKQLQIRQQLLREIEREEQQKKQRLRAQILKKQQQKRLEEERKQREKQQAQEKLRLQQQIERQKLEKMERERKQMEIEIAKQKNKQKLKESPNAKRKPQSKHHQSPQEKNNQNTQEKNLGQNREKQREGEGKRKANFSEKQKLKTIQEQKTQQISIDSKNQARMTPNIHPQKLEVIEDNSNRQQIQITKFQKTGQDFMNPVIKYLIVYNEKYYTWRRYSEIERLLDYLRLKYEGIVLPEMPPKQGIKGSFNYFWRSGVNEQFLDERKEKLKNFLNRLLSCEYVCQDQVLEKFLTDEQYELPNYNINSEGSYLQTIVGLKDIVFNYNELKDYGMAYYNYISEYKKTPINTECSQDYTKLQSIMTDIFAINEHRQLMNSNFEKRRQIMHENQIKVKGPFKTTFDKKLQEAQTQCNELNVEYGRYLQLKSTQGWENQLIKQKTAQGGEALEKIKDSHKKTLERIGKIEGNLKNSINKFAEKNMNTVKQLGKQMMEWRRKAHP